MAKSLIDKLKSVSLSLWLLLIVSIIMDIFGWIIAFEAAFCSIATVSFAGAIVTAIVAAFTGVFCAAFLSVQSAGLIFVEVVWGAIALLLTGWRQILNLINGKKVDWTPVIFVPVTAIKAVPILGNILPLFTTSSIILIWKDMNER